MGRHHVEGDELRGPGFIAIRTIPMEHPDPIRVCGEDTGTNPPPGAATCLKDMAS
jgi:hypothetical protein